jgi:hypothetical protein
LKQQLPRLFSFSRDDSTSLSQVMAPAFFLQNGLTSMDLDILVDHFHLPLSTEAHSKLQQLQDIFEGLLESDLNDRWSYFGSDVSLKVYASYKLAMGHHFVFPAIK